jgi:hypothetical protein
MPAQKSDNKTVEDIYFEHVHGKQTGDPRYKKIPVDLTTVRINKRQCLYCGNPHMANCATPYECKHCFIKRQQEVYGKTKEEAETEYKNRMELIAKGTA